MNTVMTAYLVDKVRIESGEIVSSCEIADVDPFWALMRVSKSFYDHYQPDFFGLFGSTSGDLRIQDLDDKHFWMVTWTPRS